MKLTNITKMKLTDMKLSDLKPTNTKHTNMKRAPTHLEGVAGGGWGRRTMSATTGMSWVPDDPVPMTPTRLSRSFSSPPFESPPV